MAEPAAIHALDQERVCTARRAVCTRSNPCKPRATHVHVGFAIQMGIVEVRERERRESEECAATLHEQPVESLLDRLAHLVGDAEHDHGVIGCSRPQLVGGDGIADLNDPFARQRDHAEHAQTTETAV